jgi:hypothetical protein
MRKLILFKADQGELKKYRQETETSIGSSFYRVANTGSVKALSDTIAEHHDSSNQALPSPGDRLTETVPDDRDSFRDNGWEVVRVEEYTPDIPPPYGAGFDTICICYCVYKPLPIEDQWTKKSRRSEVSIDSFGGDVTAYEAWLMTQREVVNV